jgi:hypothetical protein
MVLKTTLYQKQQTEKVDTFWLVNKKIIKIESQAVL